LLYSGNNSNGKPIYTDLGEFCNSNSDFYYISNTEGDLLWDRQFRIAIGEAIGDEVASTRFLSGKDSATNSRINQYGIEGTDILALDDFISKTLTETAIENGNDIVYIVGKDADPSAVGILTEIPTCISEFWIGKSAEEIVNNKLTVVHDIEMLKDANLESISDSSLYKTEFYFDSNGKVEGIKRYRIFKYFEDINMLLPVTTSHDIDNNIVSAEADSLGTYCVVDIEKWFNILHNIPRVDSQNSFSEVSEDLQVQTYTADNYLSRGNNLNAIFALYPYNLSDEELGEMKLNIHNAANKILKKYPSANIHIYSTDVKSHSTSIEGVDNALGSIVSLGSSYFGGYDFAYSMAKYYENRDLSNAYSLFIINENIPSSATGEHINSYVNSWGNVISSINQADINACVMRFYSGNRGLDISYGLGGKSIQNRIIGDSGALVSTGEGFYNHIFKNLGTPIEEPEEPVHFESITSTGYRMVKLDGKLSPTNGIDTDKDGLLDWDEVDTSLITIHDNGYIKLPSFKECLDIKGDELFYVDKTLEILYSEFSEMRVDGKDIPNDFHDVPILPIKSDPELKDGDGDTIDDNLDPHPLKEVEFDCVGINDITVFLKVHKVAGDNYHTSIIVFAHSYSNVYKKHKSNFTDENHYWKDIYYFTLGAGSDGLGNFLGGDLSPDFNRKNDRNLNKLTESFNLNVSDSTTIDILIECFNAYYDTSTKAEYPVIPMNTKKGVYNSNSFTHGLLKATGIAHVKPSVNVPGWEDPLPSDWFEVIGEECDCY